MKKALTFILILCSLTIDLFSQDNCKIYSTVIDSMYYQASHVDTIKGTITSNPPSLKADNYFPFKFYVDKNLYIIDEKSFFDWDIFKMKAFKKYRNFGFKMGPDSIFADCKLNDSLCYEMVDGRKFLDLDKKEICSGKNGNYPINLERLTFSNILYTKDKKDAILVIKEQYASGYGRIKLWVFALKATQNNEWKIVQVSPN